ncbi:soluble lytic murein transglycosylase [Polaromonas sp. OV174]|uniref:lytic transglycosylase domain-containing protein n=1 Tax=Polaromonas sp. OV174 TaxID=1855300 RepID=UPI0008ED301B|nr:lytic transglycosylase domain-containing protein [Polaromonas sp. OV174]SFB90849.1 soluble lytic murein transglycosylase [Polaromonas sp. OV174]
MLYKFLFSAVFTAALTASLSGPAMAQNGSPSNASAGDALMLEMNKAFKRGDKSRLTQLLPQAKGHALEPWAAYWELKTRLSDASAQEIHDFFSRYAGTYQEDRLRNDWLLLLGQRRDWTTFAAEYPNFRMNDDREVRCYALLAEHLKNPVPDARLADEVRKNWYAQRDADDGCTTAADRLVVTKNLTPHDVWQKARLATEANRPRAARDAVQIIAPDAMTMVAELNNSPIKFLSEKRLALSKTRKEIITLALIKMATSDIEGAAFQMDSKWARQLSSEERNWVWGAIGKQAATRLGTLSASDALQYFAKVSKDSDLSDEMLAWKTRAALRAGSQPSWPQVLSAINAMSDDARKDPSWTYWKARALLATLPANAPAATPPPGVAQTISIAPQRAEALALLQSIASVRGFYEQLALEELGQKITVPAKPAPLTAEEKEAARLNPALNRGAYAIAIGLRSEGVREWNYATNLHQPGSGSERGGMSDRELLAAAQFACDRQIWDRCINTSERTRTDIDFEQRFPMPFRETVVKRAQGISLDPAYVYGLIRQESRFIMDARSGVGASGLMQVMPATARWTAKKIGLDGFTTDQINDRDTNITIGTAYLKLALDDLNGSMPMAAAAYNAGPGRPRTWRNGHVLDAAIWAENVPFSETRDYVKKVLSNTTNYAAILTGQPQSLKARLGQVGPRDAAVPEPYKDLP